MSWCCRCALPPGAAAWHAPIAAGFFVATCLQVLEGSTGVVSFEVPLPPPPPCASAAEGGGVQGSF